jgi:Uma2 family endonuclease
MMDRAESAISRAWTAEEFLATDQRAFGDAWRYELVDGRIVAHAAPSPDHGAILSLLNAALVSRLRGRRDGCRAESGSGAAPVRQQRNTARIPDAMVRCGEHPRVVFEIVSPSELRAWRARNRKRRDEQETEGVQEIVELYQAEASAHMYRRESDGTWSFDAVDGLDAVLTLRSIGVKIPLGELYETVNLAAGDTEIGESP